MERRGRMKCRRNITCRRQMVIRMDKERWVGKRWGGAFLHDDVDEEAVDPLIGESR